MNGTMILYILGQVLRIEGLLMLPSFLVGLIYKGVRKFARVHVAGCVAGLFAALLNTVLFMGALILLYGNTQYLADLISGRNIIVFVCTFVGVNAVAEMLVSTAVTGALCTALERARLMGENK